MRWFALGSILAMMVLCTIVIAAILSLIDHASLHVLGTALHDPETYFAALMSIKTSVASLLISLLLAVPAAHFLSRNCFPGKVVIETILDLPMVTPPLIAGIGLLFLLRHDALLGKTFAHFGLEFLFSPAGVILAQSYIASSIIVRAARGAFDSVDPNYAANAATLGIPPFLIFLLVEIPICGRALIGAAILGWARALGEFGATLMVAGATRLKTETLPMAIYLNISSGRNDIAIACALILLSLAFVLLLVIRMSSQNPARQMQSLKPVQKSRLTWRY